jgi:hypothetical protein
MESGSASAALLAVIDFLLQQYGCGGTFADELQRGRHAAFAAFGLTRDAYHRDGALICAAWIYTIISRAHPESLDS